jgi:hypothetical protein
MQVDRLLPTAEAIEYLAGRGLKRSAVTFARWAATGEGPRYRKFDSRYRLYDPKDLDEFMRAHLGPRSIGRKTKQPAA